MIARFHNILSDYQRWRWVSPALFNTTLGSQLEQMWPKGQHFSEAAANFQTSRAQVLPNLADNVNETRVASLGWNSSPWLCRLRVATWASRPFQ